MGKMGSVGHGAKGLRMAGAPVGKAVSGRSGTKINQNATQGKNGIAVGGIGSSTISNHLGAVKSAMGGANSGGGGGSKYAQPGLKSQYGNVGIAKKQQTSPGSF